MKNTKILEDQGRQLRAILDSMGINHETILQVFMKLSEPGQNKWTPTQIYDLYSFYQLFQSARDGKGHYIDPSLN
jgi:hypothetical protein